ncbi:MAG: glucosamine-6-phosphate deaminase [Tannerellaceae bacterium]|jgi:glucosamine-6-phosphate deaminase|nr:glucosamine-6-phosphate deaminase [Tannerellaceae bacterium]
MRLIIEPDYGQLSLRAALFVAGQIEEARPTADRPFVLGLPTGSTPLGMYRELVNLHRAGKLSFRHVITFNMDEYLALPQEHPQSYHSFMWRHFFQHIDIPPGQVHILNGNAPAPEEECRTFEERMQQAGGVDLFVGGIGADGHIAFNEPGSSLASRTRMKTLAQETVDANARFFENDPDQVPKAALTVGVGTILDARQLLLLVNGAPKARALQQAVEGAVSQLWPVTAIQLHPKAIIVADEDACAEIKVATYRYFKR